MDKAIPVPVDHPGSFIAEELEARGWAQADLAYILGMDSTQLNRLIKGNQNITPDTAIALGEAFGVPAEFFMNLQNAYDLQKSKNAAPGVGTRARWASTYPLREMIKRGWIEETQPDLLDLQMLRFFKKDRIEDIPFIGCDAPIAAHAAKKTSYASTTPIQYAWLHRVKKIAESMECPLYSKKGLENALVNIRAHMMDTDDFGKIPAILQSCGIRFVIVEALPGAKVDGVCVWIDGQPAIGMTLRYNRPDNFCFVLRHELEHVLREDGKEETFAPVDEISPSEDANNPAGIDKPECERLADDAAAEFCVPRALLDSFIMRKGEYISERDVLNFSSRLEIHPAVVVGQIQNKMKKFGWLRKYQAMVNVRECLAGWKYTDGWGVRAPTGL